MVNLIKREVTAVKKDSNGEITMLCGSCGASSSGYLGTGASQGILSPYHSSWSPKKLTEVIDDIENKCITYIVKIQQQHSTHEVEIEVISSQKHVKYLRTKPDNTNKNNLDYLPNCTH